MEARDDVRFLRDLVLRADPGQLALVPWFVSWGIVWVLGFGLGVVWPAVGFAPALVNWALVACGFALPLWWMSRGGGGAVGGPTPLLLRVAYTAQGMMLLLAAALIVVTGAWGSPVVADGGVWLLIIGAGYLCAGALFPGLLAWMGLWLLAVGVAVPLLLPAAGTGALVAYAVLGGGGFLAAAAWAGRARP